MKVRGGIHAEIRRREDLLDRPVSIFFYILQCALYLESCTDVAHKIAYHTVIQENRFPCTV